jgi:hypothetical protein
VVPQASIEFEVADADAVAAAGDELQRAGYELLHPARTEPWGQTVARLLTQDGLIVGISFAPMFDLVGLIRFESGERRARRERALTEP